ncbi:MAG: aspartate aminotransferase family protein [Candidatus Kariarchaeaceae archaeon]
MSNLDKNETYLNNNKRSSELWKKAIDLFPGGISHNIRTWGLPKMGLYPPFIKKAKGAFLYTEDGQRLIDYWIGHYSNILGHTPDFLREAIVQATEEGTHLGSVNERALKLGEEIRKATPSIEQLRFCSSGSEATSYSVRLARGFTHRSLVVKMQGGWHGGNSQLFKDITPPFGTKYRGLMKDPNLISCCYNDVEEIKKYFEHFGEEIAAIILEPVLISSGVQAASKEFLQAVRQLTTKYGAVLIFDEVITGFRLSYSSAQGYFGVTPDLTCLGKIIGGGLAIGAYGGKKEIMTIANPENAESVWVGGGTFSGNPLSSATGLATLNTLKAKGSSFYNTLNKTGEDFVKSIKNLVSDYSLPIKISGATSLMSIKYDILEKQNNNSKNLPDLNIYHQMSMINKGVFVRGGLGALSSEHTQELLDHTLEALNQTFKEISLMLQ